MRIIDAKGGDRRRRRGDNRVVEVHDRDGSGRDDNAEGRCDEGDDTKDLQLKEKATKNTRDLLNLLL